jgi:E3 ubiquitin-protein ligase BRE1
VRLIYLHQTTWVANCSDDSHVEGEATTLRSALKQLDASNPDLAKHLRSEADARRQLAEANSILARYKATYGESSSLPQDTRELSERLQQKEDELKTLRLQEAQRAQAESELYGEMDKLTTAWEDAEKHLKSKVFDLTSMEQQLRKAQTEVCPASAMAGCGAQFGVESQVG